MKKSLKLTFILLVIICISLSTRVLLLLLIAIWKFKHQKLNIQKAKEFVANVYISDIKSETGIIALQAVLDYDKSNLTLFRYGWKKWLGLPQ